MLLEAAFFFYPNVELVSSLFASQFSQVLSCFAQGMNNVQVPLNLKLWRTSGCHELLASLGFDLIGVGKDEVMLRSGKANSRRAVQCTVQALCALTGKHTNYSCFGNVFGCFPNKESFVSQLHFKVRHVCERLASQENHTARIRKQRFLVPYVCCPWMHRR